jgi:hypothetical protein
MDGCIIGKCVKGQTLGCWPSAELGGRAIATHVVDQKSRLVVRHPMFFFFYTNCMGFFFSFQLEGGLFVFRLFLFRVQITGAALTSPCMYISL